jgi:hypothetical protein
MTLCILSFFFGCGCGSTAAILALTWLAEVQE